MTETKLVPEPAGPTDVEGVDYHFVDDGAFAVADGKPARDDRGPVEEIPCRHEERERGRHEPGAAHRAPFSANPRRGT